MNVLTRLMVVRHGLLTICACEDCIRVFEEIVVEELREQIARGILEIGIPELPQRHEDNPIFRATKTAQEVMRLRAADKARGK